MHSTLFALLVTLLLASSAPVRAISTQCRGRNPGLGDDCSNSWDRLWDIRSRVCSQPKIFGFYAGSRKNAFVTNADCPGRGVFFGSDASGRVDQCWRATQRAITACQLNGCRKAADGCWGTGLAYAGDEVYQTVRYLNSDGSWYSHPRAGDYGRRDAGAAILSSSQAEDFEIFVVKTGRD